MSYDVSLCDPVTGTELEVDNPHFLRGGNYCPNGSTELSLNITYNYGSIFRRADVLGKDGIPGLDGKTGAETIPLLQSAIGHLNNDVDDDYWEPTEGNAKRALCGLLSFAQMRPDGKWQVC